MFLLATLLSSVVRAHELAPQNAGTARASARVYGGDTGKPLRGAFVNVRCQPDRASGPMDRH